MKFKELKHKSTLVNSVVAVAIFFGVVVIGQLMWFRVDFTADKRWSPAKVAKNFVSGLKKPVEVTILLDGSVNSGFGRLSDAVRDYLTALSAYSRGQLTFEFVKPETIMGSTNNLPIAAFIKHAGLSPINVFEEGVKGQAIRQSVFPYAIAACEGKYFAINLLTNSKAQSGEANLNASIENIEYNMLDGFRILMSSTTEKVAFIEGHNEASELEVFDFTTALARYFRVDRGAISGKAGELDGYKAVIIAGPKTAYTEKEKYVLDQYIMNGGRVLWLVDGVKISQDSLKHHQETFGFFNDLNLGDMLFRYGVRINAQLIQDMQCAMVPVNVSAPGEPARFKPLPWYFSPLLQPVEGSIIVRNISPVKATFCSTIDAVSSNTTVTKTVLLTTSEHANTIDVPAPVDLSLSVEPVDARYFTKSRLPVAVLLEGEFQSVFTNRMVPDGVQPVKQFRDKSKTTKMVVIADGELATNDVQGTLANASALPLGYDRLTRQMMFDNRNFLMNAITYITDDDDWIQLRNKQVEMRLLNKAQSNDNRLLWQLINVLVPLVLLFVTGLTIRFFSLKKYRKTHHI